MFGLPSDSFLGIRIPKQLEKQLAQAADRLNKKENRWSFGLRRTKSSIAKRILEEFFSGKTDLKKQLDQAAAGPNVKQKGSRK